MKQIALLAAVAVIAGSFVFYFSFSNSSLDSKIEEAVAAGNYECCINPPCKMCFVGGWIFEEGECRCDKFVAGEEWEKVCPECKEGMKKGECESQKTSCEIDL